MPFIGRIVRPLPRVFQVDPQLAGQGAGIAARLLVPGVTGAEDDQQHDSYGSGFHGSFTMPAHEGA